MERRVGFSIEEITSRLLHLENYNETSNYSSDENDKAVLHEAGALSEEVIQLHRTTGSTPDRHEGNQSPTIYHFTSRTP